MFTAAYPYHEGFFITMALPDNAIRDRLHQALIDQHIYTVKVNLGLRIAICSLSMAKIQDCRSDSARSCRQPADPSCPPLFERFFCVQQVLTSFFIF